MALKRSQKIAKTSVRAKMNLLPAYEQLIVERLDGIAIPDMADAIWGRIEAALDVEMPVNDTPAAPGKSFFKNPAVWMISAGIIGIIIALFILTKNRRIVPPLPGDFRQHTKPTIKPDTIRKQDFKPPDSPKHIPDKNTSTTHAVDTAAHSAFTNEQADSLLKPSPVIKRPPDIKIPPPGMMDPPIDLKQRRKYGVEISDSDYRFNVKPKE
jgi:hypothetical protein